MTEINQEPLYYFWVYDPLTGTATIEHNEGVPKAFHKTHEDIRPDVTHPSRMNGFAYQIKGGYRLTTEDDKPVEDPFVTKAILHALRDEKGEEYPSV